MDWAEGLPYGNTKGAKKSSDMIQVIVYVLPDTRFPHRSQLMSELPENDYRTWKDHAAATLAHELEHAWQFENMEESGWQMYRKACASPTFQFVSRFDKDAFLRKTEVEAESFGIRVLQQYQRECK